MVLKIGDLYCYCLQLGPKTCDKIQKGVISPKYFKLLGCFKQHILNYFSVRHTILSYLNITCLYSLLVGCEIRTTRAFHVQIKDGNTLLLPSKAFNEIISSEYLQLWGYLKLHTPTIFQYILLTLIKLLLNLLSNLDTSIASSSPRPNQLSLFLDGIQQVLRSDAGIRSLSTCLVEHSPSCWDFGRTNSSKSARYGNGFGFIRILATPPNRLVF